MAKNDDALIFSFGVDVESIKTALDDATRDLKQRIKDANAKLKKDSLVVESQISLLDPKDDSAKIVELITKKKKAAYEVQTAILQQLTTAYNKLAEAEKKSSYGNTLETKIARQTIATQKALKALNDYQKSQTLGGSLLTVKNDIINSLNVINPAAANVVTSLDKLGQSAIKNFDLLANKAKTAKIALGGSLLIGAVYGLNSAVNGNIDAATNKAMGIEKIQRQAAALGTSFSDFNKLNTLGKLAGVDIDPLINRLNKLNLTLTKAGEEGNKQTAILDKWGIQLRNLDGSYKPFSDQVREIAKGYIEASKTGNEYAYAVEVLGGNMSEITPLLKNYSHYLEEASNLQKTGYFNTENASKIADLKRLLDLQESQTAGLGGQLSGEAAVIYLERMIELKKEWAEFAAKNKELANTVSALGITWQQTINNILKGLSKITETDTGLKVTATGGGALAGGAIGAGIGALFGGVGAIPGATLGAAIGGGMGLSFGDAMAENRKKNEEIQKNDKKTADNAEKQAERQIKAVEKINDKLEEEKRKKREAANEELTDTIYTDTHSEEEDELYNLQKKVNNYKKAEADNTLIIQYAEIERSKIIEKYRQKAIEEEKKAAEEKRKVIEEAAKKHLEEEQKEEEEKKRIQEAREKAEKEINTVFLDDHGKRLQQIEEQKQAWIKAGAAEVKATKAAEEEKRKARESEAERYLRNQSDLIKRASKLEKIGVSGDELRAQLYQYSQKQQLKSLGLTENDIITGAKYMNEINDIANSVKTAILQPVTQQLTNNTNNRTNNNVVNVNIDNPVVADNGSISRLADKVADKINDSLKVGAFNNGY